MKQISYTLAAGLLSLSLNSAHAITLQEVLNKLNNNEQYEIAKQQILIKDAVVDQVRSDIFPTITLQGQILRQDIVNILAKKQQETLSLQLLQPLYRHMREWRALDIAKTDKQVETLLTQSTEREIKQQMSIFFFELLSLQKELELTRELYDLSLKREQDLRERTRIGKSRASDLLAAQAQKTSAEASLERIRQSIENARIRLERIILSNVDKVELKDDALPKPEEISAPVWEQYPSIEASQMLVDAAQQKIKMNYGAHFPQFDLRGNYFLHQEGINNRKDWDIALVMSLPIFEGGGVSATVQEAAERWKEAVTTARKVQNDFKQRVSILHNDYVSNSKRLKTLAEAVTIHQRNYQEQQKDYRLGLVTNLEVISALNQYIEEKKNLEILKYSILSTQYQLHILAGKTL